MLPDVKLIVLGCNVITLLRVCGNNYWNKKNI